MKKLKQLMLIFPFIILALLIGLLETIAGKFIGVDWHDLYDRGSLNHGQGPKEE